MENSVARRDLVCQLAASSIFIAALVLVNPSVESGMNDDWSFVRTVHDLAMTGRLQYNGWSAPIIGFQAWWGALFAKAFGFSFFAVRASSWFLTLLAIPVLWQLLRSVELTRRQAFFGLTSFLLSPLILPNLATFMTDMPAFLLFAAALLAALKAWEAASELQALFWISVTTACGLVSGSVRQFYWLAAILFLATLALAGRRSLRFRILIAACIALLIAFGSACSYWLAKQPWVPSDRSLQAWHESPWRAVAKLSLVDMFRDFTGLAVLCLPFTLLLCLMQKRSTGFWVRFLLLGALFVAPLYWAHHMPWLGNTITNYGVTTTGTLSLGDKPKILPDNLTILLAAFGLSAALCAFWLSAAEFRKLGKQRAAKFLTASGLGRFSILTIPFLLLYLLVLAARAPAFGLYDRYLIPLFFVAIALCLGLYSRFKSPLHWIALTSAAVLALYAIATTHDYFSDARARLEATNRILASGARREAIISGFEFDLWTQTEKAGHINNKLVQFPADAYRQMEDCNGDDDVNAWWRPMVPEIKARYALSLSPFTSLIPVFPPVEYRRWLPFAKGRVYAGKVSDTEELLTCRPGSSGE